MSKSHLDWPVNPESIRSASKIVDLGFTQEIKKICDSVTHAFINEIDQLRDKYERYYKLVEIINKEADSKSTDFLDDLQAIIDA